MSSSFVFISKISEALISLYSSQEEKEKLLSTVISLQEYLEKEQDISEFFFEFGIDKEKKKEVLGLILKSQEGVDEWLENSLFILVDKNLIFHINLFLSTVKTRLSEILDIKNIYVYSGFPIISDQKSRIEKLWREKAAARECNFYYAVDKQLRLGIKVQMGTYLEEFSLASNFSDLRLKLDTILDK